jgi:nitrogen fixation NifU-like protein
MELNNLDDLYRDAILDHRRSPRNHEVLDNPDASAKAVNPFCGDEVAVQIAFSEGLISQVGVQAVGCSINQSSASMLSEALIGKTADEIGQLGEIFRNMMTGADPSPDDAAGMVDLQNLSGVRQYPVRIKCAMLSWSALEDALSEYRSVATG